MNIIEPIKLNLSPINYSTVTEMVASKFMQLLSDGTLKPGDKLPTERELAVQFNVGRTTIREALKLLTLSGLLEAKRGIGTFVRSDYNSFITRELSLPVLLNIANIHDIVEVRNPLEVQAAKLAVMRATDEEIQAISDQLDLMVANCSDYQKVADYDIKFHSMINIASHNQFLIQTMHSIQNVLRQYIELSGKMTDDFSQTYKEHYAIYKAIYDRDSKSAVAATEIHIECSINYIMKAFNNKDTSEKEQGTIGSDSFFEDNIFIIN